MRIVAHVGSRMSQMYSVPSPETPILLTSDLTHLEPINRDVYALLFILLSCTVFKMAALETISSLLSS